MDDTDRTSGVGVSRPGHIRAQASQANEMVCDHGEALAKLAEIQSLYRSLFDLSIDGIVVLDTRGRITRCNQAFAECMDLAPEELKGMNLGDLHVNPHDWARFLDLLEKTGSAKDFEWKTRTGIGRERECLATASSITGVGGIARGYQAVIRDVTDHKKSLEILVQTDRMKA
ncbi:MAG: PAS domain S-box protein, partial [Deltaproteobacteria bacterium]|nr:PAS domain S-box protein [Deltaproteobacteria bacterium]